MWLYVCTCIYVLYVSMHTFCIYVCIYVDICMYPYTLFVYMYVYTYCMYPYTLFVYMYVYMWIYVCVHRLHTHFLYRCTSTYTYSAYMLEDVYMYNCTCTCTSMSIYVHDSVTYNVYRNINSHVRCVHVVVQLYMYMYML